MPSRLLIRFSHCRACGKPLVDKQQFWCSRRCKTNGNRSTWVRIIPADTRHEVLPARPAWQALAACAGLDANLFFPERGVSTAPAKAVCRGCPVKDECLDYALENKERFGVFGGLSERERRYTRSQRRLRISA